MKLYGFISASKAAYGVLPLAWLALLTVTKALAFKARIRLESGHVVARTQEIKKCGRTDISVKAEHLPRSTDFGQRPPVFSECHTRIMENESDTTVCKNIQAKYLLLRLKCGAVEH